MRLRLATYNVHDCIGLDGRYDPERIASVIASLDADVVAVQEITLDHAGDLLRQLEAQTRLKGIDGTLFHRGIGRYGNLLLTRLKVLETRLHDLSLAGREPRGAIDATLVTESGPLRVIATHLGLRAGERRHQLNILSDLAGRGPANLTVLGDLNLWHSARVPRGLARLGMHGVLKASFPVRPWPMFRLDRILVSEAISVLDHRRHERAPAGSASDHYPLVADVLCSRVQD